MKKINDGGPVYPNPALADPTFSAPCDMSGMTLRQYFAGLAFAAMIGKAKFLDREGENGEPITPDDLEQFRLDIAASSIEYADALIAELEKNGPAPHDIATGEIG